jgi:hypothetical protein
MRGDNTTEPFIPNGYAPLEQAVLQLAKRLDPSAWEPSTISHAEVEFLSQFGRTTHDRDLKWSLCEKGDPSKPAVKRLQSIRRAKDKLRRDLFDGAVPFVLQLVATGEHVTEVPTIWGQENAPTWFDDGRVFIGSGESEWVPFGPYTPGLPFDVNFAPSPIGEWAVALIETRELVRYLNGGPPLRRAAIRTTIAQRRRLSLQLDKRQRQELSR